MALTTAAKERAALAVPCPVHLAGTGERCDMRAGALGDACMDRRTVALTRRGIARHLASEIRWVFMQTYRTSAQAMFGEGPDLDKPVRCPSCDAGPGRQSPLRDASTATGWFSCEACRTRYCPGD